MKFMEKIMKLLDKTRKFMNKTMKFMNKTWNSWKNNEIHGKTWNSWNKKRKNTWKKTEIHGKNMKFMKKNMKFMEKTWNSWKNMTFMEKTMKFMKYSRPLHQARYLQIIFLPPLGLICLLDAAVTLYLAKGFHDGSDTTRFFIFFFGVLGIQITRHLHIANIMVASRQRLWERNSK